MRREVRARYVVVATGTAATRSNSIPFDGQNIIISDDGLQHVRLKREFQIIVFDARGAGNGWLLPAGPLRQPLPREVPRRSVVVYNCEQASTPLPGCMAHRSDGSRIWKAETTSRTVIRDGSFARR